MNHIFKVSTVGAALMVAVATQGRAQEVAQPGAPAPPRPAVAQPNDPPPAPPRDRQSRLRAAVVADSGYAPAIRYPDQSLSFLDHSSTAGEGYLRGAGALARGVGAANLDHSLAAMNYQEAYRRSLENSLRYAETYYARRDLWFDYQEATRREPLSMEGYRRIAEAEGANRLTAEQIDLETGKIRWPALLEADVLEPYRITVEEALANRSVSEVGLGSRTYERVRRSVEAMRAILDRNRKSLPSHLYVNATQVLDSVQFESRFAPPAADTADSEE